MTTDTVLRKVLKHAETLTKVPGYPVGVHTLIRWEALATALVEHQSRVVAHLLRSTTQSELRARAERAARAERRGAVEAAGTKRRRPGPTCLTGPGGEPTVFWHEGGDGSPVLLLNGWTASGLLWPGEWVRSLEERHRVLRVDNRGTGWSRTAPAPFTIGDMADDAAAVLQAAASEPATVVGLSMGGMIAQELAIRHPDLVKRLVLVSTRPPAPANIPAPPHVMDRELGQLLATPDKGGDLAAYFRSVWEPQTAPGFAESNPAVFEELAAQILERVTPRPAVINQLRAIAAWSGPSRLRRITAETTILHGLADELIPVGNGMRLARLIPTARYLELRNVGHLIPLEAPDTLTEVIRSN